LAAAHPSRGDNGEAERTILVAEPMKGHLPRDGAASFRTLLDQAPQHGCFAIAQRAELAVTNDETSALQQPPGRRARELDAHVPVEHEGCRLETIECEGCEFAGEIVRRRCHMGIGDGRRSGLAKRCEGYHDWLPVLWMPARVHGAASGQRESAVN